MNDGESEALEKAFASGQCHAANAIAYRIRAELVCCNQYNDLERLRDRQEAAVEAWGHADWMAAEELTQVISAHGGGICYWGEAAARLAEDPTSWGT